jgi:hypothetical protein
MRKYFGREVFVQRRAILLITSVVIQHLVSDRLFIFNFKLSGINAKTKQNHHIYNYLVKGYHLYRGT